MLSRVKFVLRVLIIAGIFASIIQSSSAVRSVERFSLVGESGVSFGGPPLDGRSLLRLALAAISLSLL